MALALTRWYQADLHVVRVESRFRSRSKRLEAGAGEDAVEDFAAAVNVAAITFETVVLTGDPVDALVDYSRLISAELIVMGQHGRRGSPYWSAGTFAKRVADGVGCPTITVPRDSAPQTLGNAPFRTILCGIDFSQSSALALSQALLIAQQSGGRLTLLHVYERFSEEVIPGQSLAPRLPREHRAHVDDLELKLKSLVPANASNGEIETEIVAGTARDAITATAVERGADLIAIGQPRRTPHRIVMGSTVGAVLRRARCPVLTVPSSPIGNDVTSTWAAAVTSEDGHMPSLARR